MSFAHEKALANVPFLLNFHIKGLLGYTLQEGLP